MWYLFSCKSQRILFIRDAEFLKQLFFWTFLLSVCFFFIIDCYCYTQTFKTKEQLITHNCEQSGQDTKKHTSSQLPKRASGSFKPRKPTPKRQTLSKTAAPLADKEKLEDFKNDEIQKKVIYKSISLFCLFFFCFFRFIIDNSRTTSIT